MTSLSSFAGIAGDVSLDINGRVWVSGFDNRVYSVLGTAALNTTPTLVFDSGIRNFHTPLQGSDGHVYVPRRTGYLMAFDSSGVVNWVYDPAPAIARTLAMDCGGRLYVEIGDTGAQQQIWVFVTDDKGLGDTGWPNARRDSRNTGNTSALKYGIRTGGGCTQ